jgi:hypothetical protein
VCTPPGDYDHGAAAPAARSHCRGGSGEDEGRGPLWSPWGGVGPLAQLSPLQPTVSWSTITGMGKRGAARPATTTSVRERIAPFAGTLGGVLWGTCLTYHILGKPDPAIWIDINANADTVQRRTCQVDEVPT